MILTADYHTHTPYSHGQNTVAENVQRAKELGMKEVGITDHGFLQLSMGLKRKELPAFLQECTDAEKEYGIRVLKGMEANILGEDGETDMTEKDYEKFDLFVCGKHVFIKYSTMRDFNYYLFGNFMTYHFHLKPKQKLIDFNTKAYINMIKNNPVDIVSHLCYQAPADALEVAKCAADYGTYIELNTKKKHLTDEQLLQMLDTKVRFVIDSDAHTASRVGDTKLVEEQLARINFPMDRIDNIDGRLPNFRFTEYKKRM